MTDVHDIWSKTLLREIHTRRRRSVQAAFPELVSARHDHYLSLHDFLVLSPERFFPRDACATYLARLSDLHASNSTNLADYLRDYCAELNRAFGFLAEINRQEWHERKLPSDEYERIRFLDRTLLPAYLRLIEGVLFPFLHLMAFFSRRERGRSQEGLEIYGSVQELQGGPLGLLTKSYRNTVRNGVAHGGIVYAQGSVTLRDKKGNEDTLSHSEITMLVDNLIDSCNGMGLALKVFFAQHGHGRYEIPSQVMLHELQAETEAPWWHVEGSVESRIDTRSQLVVFARPSTRDLFKVQYSAFQTGVLAELLAPGYDRYFVSLRSKVAWPGWAAFDGARLREIRETGPKSILDYNGALEGNLVFYVTRPRLPRILGKVDTLRRSLLLNLPLGIADVKRNLGLPEISVRSVSIHRNGAYAVVRASVVLKPIGNSIDKNTLRKARRRIIGVASRAARGTSHPLSPLRLLPLGYARVAVFQRDHRERELVSYGLGPDLVGTVQVRRLRRIESPDIAGSTIEDRGRYRIAWNRSWLDQQESG